MRRPPLFLLFTVLPLMQCMQGGGKDGKDNGTERHQPMDSQFPAEKLITLEDLKDCPYFARFAKLKPEALAHPGMQKAIREFLMKQSSQKEAQSYTAPSPPSMRAGEGSGVHREQASPEIQRGAIGLNENPGKLSTPQPSGLSHPNGHLGKPHSHPSLIPKSTVNTVARIGQTNPLGNLERSTHLGSGSAGMMGGNKPSGGVPFDPEVDDLVRFARERRKEAESKLDKFPLSFLPPTTLPRVNAEALKLAAQEKGTKAQKNDGKQPIMRGTESSAKRSIQREQKSIYRLTKELAPSTSCQQLCKRGKGNEMAQVADGSIEDRAQISKFLLKLGHSVKEFHIAPTRVDGVLVYRKIIVGGDTSLEVKVTEKDVPLPCLCQKYMSLVDVNKNSKMGKRKPSELRSSGEEVKTIEQATKLQHDKYYAEMPEEESDDRLRTNQAKSFIFYSFVRTPARHEKKDCFEACAKLGADLYLTEGNVDPSFLIAIELMQVDSRYYWIAAPGKSREGDKMLSLKVSSGYSHARLFPVSRRARLHCLCEAR